MSRYVDHDHAAWLQDNLAAIRKRKALPDIPETLSDFHRQVAFIIGMTAGGIYNAPINWRSARFGERFVEVNWRSGEFATWDFMLLTNLVFLAHEECVRVSVGTAGPGIMKVTFHCRRRGGGMGRRHPTLDQAVDAFRAWYDPTGRFVHARGDDLNEPTPETPARVKTTLAIVKEDDLRQLLCEAFAAGAEQQRASDDIQREEGVERINIVEGDAEPFVDAVLAEERAKAAPTIRGTIVKIDGQELKGGAITYHLGDRPADPATLPSVEDAFKMPLDQFVGGFQKIAEGVVPVADVKQSVAAVGFLGLQLARRVIVYFGADTTPEQLERDKMDADAEVLRMAKELVTAFESMTEGTV